MVFITAQAPACIMLIVITEGRDFLTLELICIISISTFNAFIILFINTIGNRSVFYAFSLPHDEPIIAICTITIGAVVALA